MKVNSIKKMLIAQNRMNRIVECQVLRMREYTLHAMLNANDAENCMKLKIILYPN